MSTNRLESFSDGVIAVAITLLVLNIAVPNPATTPRLGHALGVQWPIYAAYATSFITIGIIWVNHHVMLGRLARADRSILMLNLLLLMSIGVIPFGTALLATYLKQGHGQNLAAGIYGAIMLVMSVAFSILNRHILLARADLHRDQLPHEQRRQILFRSVTGLLPYAVATGLAAISPYVTLVICAAVAVFYATPLGSGGAAARPAA